MEHVFKLDKSAAEPDILLWKLEFDVFDGLFCYEEIKSIFSIVESGDQLFEVPCLCTFRGWHVRFAEMDAKADDMVYGSFYYYHDLVSSYFSGFGISGMT
ncbi:hypothetical protein RHMOL_Rhmol10G0303500 [Rhododendron molle]|uniref:Uncharacterized protein n=1 Tax=Rhododendron molle TaxID=49168 RepID=A0ACC0M7U7_RHOML|nr:hypothetical protein RHMOL_Rhmol10G0303500 [Rhododendron molle]